VLSLREREFVEAARSLGAGNWRIMTVDILPNLLMPIIVYASLQVPIAVVSEATLAYLGLGVPAPTPDWGDMINQSSQADLYQHAWWMVVFPGAALLLTTLAFNLLGDGVRDAFDPNADRLLKK
jgi:peptide/nickel transport system permease protein